MIKALEKENKYLRRKLEKASKHKKWLKSVKVLEGNADNDIEIHPHESSVLKNRLDKGG